MNKGYFEYAKHGSIGISWVLTTVIYFYLGYKGGMYLDGRFDSAPLFLLVGMLGAVALSMWSLVSGIQSLLAGSGSVGGGDKRVPDREKSNKDAGGTKETRDPARKGPR